VEAEQVVQHIMDNLLQPVLLTDGHKFHVHLDQTVRVKNVNAGSIEYEVKK